jgi:glutathione S-transferase
LGGLRRSSSEGFSKDQVDESTERLRQTVERIDAAIAKGPWLAGGQISLADLCVLPTIVRMSDIRLESVWTDLPHFQNWYGRMRARPSFATAYYPGSRVPLPPQ